MRRSRKSARAAQEIIQWLAYLPWWLSLATALLAYAVLHTLSQQPLVFPSTSSSTPWATVGGSFISVMCFFLQFFIPTLLLVGMVHGLYRRTRRRALLNSAYFNGLPMALQDMSWAEFELLIGEAYRRQGYSVEETGQGGADGGVDLILRRGQNKYLVQCKHWRSTSVGVNVIRELYGLVAAGADRGIIVTSGQFTKDAIDFARGKPLELIGREALAELISRAKTGKPSVSTLALQPPLAAAICPRCGNSLVLRTARQGAHIGQPFYGCTAYPSCKFTRDIN